METILYMFAHFCAKTVQATVQKRFKKVLKNRYKKRSTAFDYTPYFLAIVPLFRKLLTNFIFSNITSN